ADLGQALDCQLVGGDALVSGADAFDFVDVLLVGEPDRQSPAQRGHPPEEAAALALALLAGEWRSRRRLGLGRWALGSGPGPASTATAGGESEPRGQPATEEAEPDRDGHRPSLCRVQTGLGCGGRG